MKKGPRKGRWGETPGWCGGAGAVVTRRRKERYEGEKERWSWAWSSKSSVKIKGGTVAEQGQRRSEGTGVLAKKRKIH